MGDGSRNGLGLLLCQSRNALNGPDSIGKGYVFDRSDLICKIDHTVVAVFENNGSFQLFDGFSPISLAGPIRIEGYVAGGPCRNFGHLCTVICVPTKENIIIKIGVGQVHLTLTDGIG